MFECYRQAPVLKGHGADSIIQIHPPTHKQLSRETDECADWQTDQQTYKWTDWHTDQQTDQDQVQVKDLVQVQGQDLDQVQDQDQD